VQAIKIYRGGGGTAPVILALALEGWVSGQLHTPAALPSGRVHVNHEYEAGGGGRTRAGLMLAKKR